MPKRSPEEIVPGITIDRQGIVSVAEGLQQRLCNIALALQECTPHAVDVEHVLAAVVMAIRDGKLPRTSELTCDNSEQTETLLRYVNVLFERYAGEINREK